MSRLMRGLAVTIAALMLLTLAACGKPTKEEMLRKTDKVETKAQLQAMLGTPDDIAKLGPAEVWTYKASNGEVIFLITGERVALQATGK